MDLIQLTQMGKLLWKRLTEPDTIHGETYEAKLSGNTLRLQTTGIFIEPLENYSFWSTHLGGFKPNVRNERKYPSLRVMNGSELVTAFPDVAALRGLAEAVQERAKERDEAFLQAIHQVIKQVAE